MHPSQGREGNRGLTEWSPQKCRWGRLVAQDRTIPLHPPLVSIQDKPVAGSWAWSTPGCGQVRSRRTGLLSGEAAPKPLAAHPPSHRGSATVEEMEEEGPRRQEESLGPACCCGSSPRPAGLRGGRGGMSIILSALRLWAWGPLGLSVLAGLPSREWLQTPLWSSWCCEPGRNLETKTLGLVGTWELPFQVFARAAWRGQSHAVSMNHKLVKFTCDQPLPCPPCTVPSTTVN